MTAAAAVVSEVASAVVAIRPAAADVLSVTATPQAVVAGTPTAVSAEVFNTANATRSLEAQLQVLDSTGSVVATEPLVPFSIDPSNDSVMVSLGQLDTAGLANGLYELNVSLLTSVGTTLPGSSAEVPFLVGIPVSATASASPRLLAPGTSTVTTNITTSNQPQVAQQAFGNIEVVYNATNSFTFDGKPLGVLDGPAFVIQNTSDYAISDGVLSIGPGGVSTPDSYDVGTIPAGGNVVIVPGLSNDGQSHPSGGFFAYTGSNLDTSDSGPNEDDVQFEFTGMGDGVKLDSGIFTPAATQGASDDGTVSNLNFLGGPGDNDQPCTNCFGPAVVADHRGLDPGRQRGTAELIDDQRRGGLR